ncbi:MAG: hypothetical protein K1X29_07330 [Bdellovibrionales bacterium]|nr:hypothetical protein [Bdellovibrionales bacterium]
MIDLLKNQSFFRDFRDSDSIKMVRDKFKNCLEEKKCRNDYYSKIFTQLPDILLKFRVSLAITQYSPNSRSGFWKYNPTMGPLLSPSYFQSKILYDPLSYEETIKFKNNLEEFWDGKKQITGGLKFLNVKTGGVVDKYILFLEKKIKNLRKDRNLSSDPQIQEKLNSYNNTLQLFKKNTSIEKFEKKIEALLGITDTDWNRFLHREFSKFKEGHTVRTWQFYSKFRPLIYLTKSEPDISELIQALNQALSDNSQLVSKLENKKSIIFNSLSAKGAPFEEITDILEYSFYVEKYLHDQPQFCQIAETRTREILLHNQGIMPFYFSLALIVIALPIPISSTMVLDIGAMVYSENSIREEKNKIKSNINLNLTDRDCFKYDIDPGDTSEEIDGMCENKYIKIIVELNKLNWNSVINISVGIGMPISNKFYHLHIMR